MGEFATVAILDGEPVGLNTESAFGNLENKCDRCWRHYADRGKNSNYPTVCLRCAEALDAIDFPPYAATIAQQTT